MSSIAEIMSAKREARPLTQEYLKERLEYSPESGIFRWKWYKISDNLAAQKRWEKQYWGAVAGTCHKATGYIIINMKLECGSKAQFRAHRLAWLYVHGEWPKEYIDHIDRDPANNALANLRECTHGQNRMNSAPNKGNKTGYKCVVPAPSGKYQAFITVKGVREYLGTHDTPAEASFAYMARALEVGGEFVSI